MSSENKKNTSRKTNNGVHNKNTKKRQSSKVSNADYKKASFLSIESTFLREIVLWIVVAVSILLFISNFGIGGIIGS